MYHVATSPGAPAPSTFSETAREQPFVALSFWDRIVRAVKRVFEWLWHCFTQWWDKIRERFSASKNPGMAPVAKVEKPERLFLSPLEARRLSPLNDHLVAARIAAEQLPPDLQECVQEAIDSIAKQKAEQLTICGQEQGQINGIVDTARIELEHLIHCVESWVRDSGGSFLAPSLPSPEALDWQRQIKTALRTCEIAHMERLLQEERYRPFLNVKFRNFMGGIILHELAKTERWSRWIPLALTNGCDQNARDDVYGNTPLLWAIAQAVNGAALELITRGDAGAEFFNAQCFRGNTALLLAVSKGYREISADLESLPCSNLTLVQELCLKGAKVNLANEKGNTPLHLACARRDVEMIEILLAAGADKEKTNQEGKTPLDFLEFSYSEATALLFDTVSAFLLSPEEHASSSRLQRCRELLADS